jgi:hypothetical protein
MNRRRLLLELIGAGALALGPFVPGYLEERKRASERELALSRRRAELASRMLDDALPSLRENSLREEDTLARRAREEILRYFHGICLNVEGFVSRICSDVFVARLGRCRTQNEREVCFLEAFCSRVATEADILSQVEIIAAGVGSELDSGWAAYCTELSGRWNTRIQGYGSPLAMDELSNRLGGMIRAELAQAARQAVSDIQRPAIGETIGRVGQSAILLLPLVRFGQVGLGIGIPLFLLLAARNVWDFAAESLKDRRGDYQRAISSQLARMGTRVGAEFEREIRLRLTDLHTWQEHSVRQTATRLAQERVGPI